MWFLIAEVEKSDPNAVVSAVNQAVQAGPAVILGLVVVVLLYAVKQLVEKNDRLSEQYAAKVEQLMSANNDSDRELIAAITSANSRAEAFERLVEKNEEIILKQAVHLDRLERFFREER